MTLDESYRSSDDFVRAAEADRARQDWQDYLEECELESIDAEESHWTGVMAAQPEWMRDVTYREWKVGYDTRLFGGPA